MSDEVSKWFRGEEVLTQNWLDRCLGKMADHPAERAVRLCEEAIECAQCLDVPEETMHALVRQVYKRQKEEHIWKEIGGVQACLFALSAQTKVPLLEAYLQTVYRIHDPKVMRRIHERNLPTGDKVHAPGFEYLGDQKI